MSAVAPPRPLLPVRLWKLDGLGDRYAPTEQIKYPAERFLQTYAVSLTAFTAVTPTLDVQHPSQITFRFNSPGSVYLDDVGFEPAAVAAN